MKNLKSYLIVPAIFFLLSSCNSGYNKQDKKWVWISYDEAVGKRVSEIDQHDFETFKILNNEKYATDKNSVFYVGQIIKNADPESFEVLNNGYSKDINNIFLDATTVIFADSKTFEQLEFPYSKDKNSVFCGTIPLEINRDEVTNFVVTNENELMSNMRTTASLSHFIEMNPKYKWLDTLNIDGVIIGEWGTGQTKKRKFKGFKEVK